jgi:DNA-binding beta-propeller fold protein YncE
MEDGNWNSFDGDAGGSEIASGAFFQPSILIDNDDQPHIFWENSPPGTSDINYTFWDGSGWSEIETIAGPFACCPKAAVTQDGKPAVAFIEYPTGYGEPIFLFKEGDWRPWPDLPRRISPEPGESWGIFPSFTDGDVPLVVFDNYFQDKEEIYCAFPLTGKVQVDTSPPVPPGTISIEEAPAKNTVSLLFGRPAMEQNFKEYVIEASNNLEFTGEFRRWDRHNDPCLGHLDYAGKSGTVMEGLGWGQSYYFRITAVDLAGHRSSSLPAGPVMIPDDIYPPEIVIETPEDGVVLPDRMISIEGTIDDHSATVTIGGESVELIEGYFQSEVSLVEGDNEILVRAIDESENETTVTVNLVSIPLDINSPPAGSFVRGKLLEISGEAGSNCSLITSGEYYDLPADGFWSISPLPISEGESFLFVRAHDALGRYSERGITVSGSDEDFSIQITSLPSCGAAPLDVYFSLDAGGLEDSAYLSWDADGDGQAEAEGLGLRTFNFRYGEPGIYYPEVVLTDDAGVSYRERGRVRVHLTPGLIAALPVSSPKGVALDDEGFLYISEEVENRVLILDDRLEFYGEITEDGGDGVSLESPAGLEVDELGFIWVCDSGNTRVLAFDREGGYYGRWIWLNHPFESISHDGPIFYATEMGGSRIFKFERKFIGDALALTTWGSVDLSMEEYGGVSDLGGLTMERGGRVLISDTAGDRIQTYRDEPSFAENLHYIGQDPREVLSPKSIFFCHRTGMSAVVEELTGQVRLFDSIGDPAVVIGSEAFDGIPLNNPGDIAIREEVEGTYLYVADTGNDRILVVLVPSESPLAAVEAFRQAVQSGDVESIMETIHPIGMERTLAKIEDLGGNLPAAAPYFEDVEIVSIEGNLARGQVIIPMTIEEVTGDFEFEIILMKDRHGHWKMLDF